MKHHWIWTFVMALIISIGFALLSAFGMHERPSYMNTIMLYYLLVIHITQVRNGQLRNNNP